VKQSIDVGAPFLRPDPGFGTQGQGCTRAAKHACCDKINVHRSIVKKKLLKAHRTAGLLLDADCAVPFFVIFWFRERFHRFIENKKGAV